MKGYCVRQVEEEAIGRRYVIPQPWPEPDPAQLVSETVRLVVQVNGKKRDELEVPADADEETIRRAALATEGVARHLAGREPRKVIVVAGRLVNVVG